MTLENNVTPTLSLDVNQEVIKSLGDIKEDISTKTSELSQKLEEMQTKEAELVKRLGTLEENTAKSLSVKNKEDEAEITKEGKAFYETVLSSQEGGFYQRKEKYQELAHKSFSDMGLYAQRVANYNAGGIFCPPEVSKDLIDYTFHYSNTAGLLGRVKTARINSRSIKYPAVTSRPMIGRVKELENAPVTLMEFGELEVAPQPLAVLNYESYELERFSNFDLRGTLRRLVSVSMAERMAWEIMKGTIPEQGYEGILTNKDIVVHPTSVANKISLDDLFYMDGYDMYGADYAFFMHRTTWAYLRTLKDANNNYYNNFDVTERGVPRINGVPVVLLGEAFIPDILLGEEVKRTAGGEKILKGQRVRLMDGVNPTQMGSATPFVTGSIPIILADLSVAYQQVIVDDLEVKIDSDTLMHKRCTRQMFTAFNGGRVIQPKAIIALQVS